MTKTVPVVAAIDIGSHKVSILVGKVYAANHIEVIGAAHALNHGMNKGKITNLDKVVLAIKTAVQEAEEQIRGRIDTAWVSIPNTELTCEFAQGHTQIQNHEVSSEDLSKILDLARNKSNHQDNYLLKTVPLGFSIDRSEEWIDSPLGLSGSEMTGYYQFVRIPINTVNNLSKALQHANIGLDDGLVPSILAMAESSLLPDERRYGVCLIDMGANTTTVSVYLRDNKLAYLKSFEMGGDLITQEIASTWRTTTEEAERIKIFHGSVDKDNIPAEQGINIQTTTGVQYYSRKELALIVTAVYERMFDTIYRDLYHHHLLEQISHGVVLTGQATQIDSAVNLVRRKFNVAVHLANSPQQLTASNDMILSKIRSPIYAAASGLLLLSQQDFQPLGIEQSNELSAWDKISQAWENLCSSFKKHF